jgi:vacuolar protein sorting-associated protein 13A/C
MLESLITSIFNRYLGPFVENIDGSQLKLKLFTGRLQLRNVVVKPDALARLLDLPVRVVAGTIGSINVDIPVSALRSKPIVVQLDEVYVLAAPHYGAQSVAGRAVQQSALKAAMLGTIERHYVAAAAAAAPAEDGWEVVAPKARKPKRTESGEEGSSGSASEE